MKPDKSIVEFLCRDENLAIALEVGEAFNAVCDNIEDRFLDKMQGDLFLKFSKSDLLKNWKLVKDLGTPSKTRRYASVYLDSKVEHDHYLYYVLCIARESSEFYVYYGLEWAGVSDEEPKDIDTRAGSSLITFLKDKEFERNKWTIGRKTVASFMSRKEMLLTLQQRATELSALWVDDFWAFVQKTSDMVETTNDTLNRKPNKAD